jgi:hypothetical protein
MPSTGDSNPGQFHATLFQKPIEISIINNNNNNNIYFHNQTELIIEVTEWKWLIIEHSTKIGQLIFIENQANVHWQNISMNIHWKFNYCSLKFKWVL